MQSQIPLSSGFVVKYTQLDFFDNRLYLKQGLVKKTRPEDGKVGVMFDMGNHIETLYVEPGCLEIITYGQT